MGQTVVIDTTPAVVDYSEGTISSGDRINAADHGSGTIRISGNGEAGSRVEITIDDTTHGADVRDDGTWFVDFASTEIAGGDRVAEISIKTIDAFGNSDTFIEYMDIDTILPVIGASSVDGDNGAGSNGFVVNKDDVSLDGQVTINGTGEAGASYRVELNNGSGAFQTGEIGDDGTWAATFSLADLGGLSDVDGYNVPFTMTSIDDFGNPSLEVQDTIHVDTLADVDFGTTLSGASDHVASAQDFVDNGHNNLILTGTSEPGTTSVRVTMNGFTRDAVVDSDTGEWSVTFEPGTYQTGTHTYEASAVSMDEHGNKDTADMTVRVDTEVTNLTVSNRPALGDDSYIGLDDAAGGVNLTGTMEKNWTDLDGTPTVWVEFAGENYQATVDGVNGTWSVHIPESGIPMNYEDSLIYTVTGTDSVGNVQPISRSIEIDTRVPDGVNVTGFSADFNSGTLQYEDFDIDAPKETLGVARVNENGSIADLAPDANGQFNDYGTGPIRGQDNQLRIELTDSMSDGENLIITESDAAGNTSGTYVILEGGPTAQNMDNGNLSNYQIETIILGATDTALTLTEADIKALSTNSDVVTIRGEAKSANEADSGDSVTIIGAQKEADPVTEGGVDYNVYTLGDTTIYIEDEITNVITI